MAYRLLYFRDNLLVDWEVLEAADHLAAMAIASSRHHSLTVELWSEGKKIAIFKPSGTRHRR